MADAKLSWQHDNGKLAFDGELTRATVPAAWEQRDSWQSEAGDQLQVDLSEVEHVDSAGVAMLLQLKKYLMQKDCELTILNPSQQFKAIVEVSGGTDLLELASEE
ncbi:STAS domain-containing protein [Pseudidiomarina insulisalsae]|uniref:Sulfate transporter n=1 Tax=Pseudidiomarina insulisalsae TaxID=575789 RepID=A0A432YN89_9GAMM|nr:STAS domain-containing protein [Pseudidiomarina insulisalsae]RUO62457.1 sulfate transporter [Pseudidiomarina insulisalsae]